MANATWKDLDGKTHKLFTIRSLGPGRGFGILNISAMCTYLRGIAPGKKHVMR